MANKDLFKSSKFKAPVTDTQNNAGGNAYSFVAKHHLAQLACTGFFGSTYYVDADNQLNEVLTLEPHIDDKFIAKVAIYARKQAFTKDMPALLLAILMSRGSEYFEVAFKEVIDNGKMLRNFVQIVRSGVTGRKSFGSKAKRLIIEWLNNSRDDSLINANIGNNPSLTDIIKMVHPKPNSVERDNLFKYIMGYDYDVNLLPTQLKDFIKFDKDTKLVPRVPFQMLTHLPLTTDHWKQISRNMGWQALRMNLNTLQRNGVFDDKDVKEYIENKLKNSDDIEKSRVYPYQLLSAYLNVDGNIPQGIKNSLQYAMEEATKNIPELSGNVYILVDVSGSMSSPVTGYRGTVTSKISCLDAAAVMASALLRKCPEAVVIPFEIRVRNLDLNPLDTIMTNAEKLRSIEGGGTNCSCALKEIINRGGKVDTIIMISDNESWIDTKSIWRNNQTETMRLFKELQKQNKDVKMVCIDITPNSTSQTSPDKAILNIGGFSDRIFDVVKSFVDSDDDDHWIKVIENIKL